MKIPVLQFLVAGLLTIPIAAQPQTTAIVGATFIDGTGAPPKPDAVVLIEGARISAVGTRATVSVPPDAQVIQASGKYVIPGLVDTNVHLVLQHSEGWLARYEGQYEDPAAEAAQLFLKNGVTTIFDTRGPIQPLLNVRDRIRRGELLASRLYIAGTIIGLGGPLSRESYGPDELAHFSPELVKRVNAVWELNVGPGLLDDSADEVRAETRKYIKTTGVDFLKFAASSDTINGIRGSWLSFSPEAAKAIVEEGHAAGMIVESHTGNIESLRLALLSGIDLAQHPEGQANHEMPDELVRMIVQRGVYCAVFALKKDRVERLRVISSAAAGARNYGDENIQKLIRADARITMALDASVEDPEFPWAWFRKWKLGPGEAEFQWLEAIVEKGMPPMDAIVAATRNGAAAYHHLSEFGTIERGKFADLLILDANPIESISNVRKISVVMKEGKIINRDRLPEHKVLTK